MQDIQLFVTITLTFQNGHNSIVMITCRAYNMDKMVTVKSLALATFN